MAAKSKKKSNPYAPPPGEVVELRADAISRLVDIHGRSLQYSLASALGPEFLTAWYNGLFSSDAFRGLLFKDAQGRSAGFCVYSTDPARMNRQARADQRRDLFLKVIDGVQRDPSLLTRVLSVRGHQRKLDQLRIQPEITFVAWDGAEGIGDALLVEALRRLVAAGVDEVRAVVPVNDGPHCNLMERHQFRVGATFRSLGNELNIFKIDAEGMKQALDAADEE